MTEIREYKYWENNSQDKDLYPADSIALSHTVTVQE